MTENTRVEGAWGGDHLADEDASGIRWNPWAGRLRALQGPAQDGFEGGASARVLARFGGFTREDRDAVIASAIGRLARDAHVIAPTEARVAHTVLQAAIQRERRRWVAQIRASRAVITRELGRAGERVAALTGRERLIFFAVCALDDVAYEEEVRRVVLCGAVAYQVRWNTAHQNLSRAWRRICEGGPLGDWCSDWRGGHRFVCGAPPFELWAAGRAYLDTCSARAEARSDGASSPPPSPPPPAPPAFDAWVEAHDAHQEWFNEWKRQSAHATRRWRDFAAALDASPVRPAAVQALLVARCATLGIDRWVVPAKVCHQSWRDLLDASHRPAPPARRAWLGFLRESGFGPAAEAAFRALERDADLVDVANVELEAAYQRLLAAAEAQPSDTLRARNTFRDLVDTVTIMDRTLTGDEGEPLSWGGRAAW